MYCKPHSHYNCMSPFPIPQIPFHHVKETQFLGPFLLENPLMFEILDRIREKHDIDDSIRLVTLSGNAYYNTWNTSGGFHQKSARVFDEPAFPRWLWIAS